MSTRAPASSCFQNFELLPIANGEAADWKTGFDGKAQAIGKPPHAAAQFGWADQPRKILEVKRDIFPDGERRNQAEVLEDHADAVTTCLARRGDRHPLARNPKLARIGPVVAIEDFAEGAFAGAVLSDQCNDLTGLDRKRGNVVRQQRSKPLDHAMTFEQRSCVGHRPS